MLFSAESTAGDTIAGGSEDLLLARRPPAEIHDGWAATAALKTFLQDGQESDVKL